MAGTKDQIFPTSEAARRRCTPGWAAAKLYHNLGGGRFEDVSQKAGIADPNSKSLGVTALDYNGDGWPDLFVANDTQPNKLYRNQKNGTFKDEAVEAGVAFSEEGTARGAMGVDAADYDRSGRPYLLVGNFTNEMLALYHNEGNGVFVDEAPSSSVGQASLLTLTFGAFFFDYDLDGLPDILAANGHLEEEINRVQPKVTYKQAPLLFRNLGKGKFQSVAPSLGPDLARPIVARGAAYGDLDNDGDLDVVITTNHGPAYVFRNDGGNRNHWLRVRTVGTKSSRDGLGAVVRVTSAGGKQWTMVRSGSSCFSQSQMAPTFGAVPGDRLAERLQAAIRQHAGESGRDRGGGEGDRTGRRAADESVAVSNPGLSTLRRSEVGELLRRLLPRGSGSNLSPLLS